MLKRLSQQVVASLRSAVESITKLNGMVWTGVTDACGSEAVAEEGQHAQPEQAGPGAGKGHQQSAKLATADGADAAKHSRTTQ